MPCTSPDTDGAGRGALHYGYCNGCGWESPLTTDADLAHAWMEVHRLEALNPPQSVYAPRTSHGYPPPGEHPAQCRHGAYADCRFGCAV